MKKILISLILLLTFGSAISANKTDVNQSNNFLPNSNVTKPFPNVNGSYVVMFGVTLIPGPSCFASSCPAVFNNCIAEGFSQSYCFLAKRDCQSICLGGWIL